MRVTVRELAGWTPKTVTIDGDGNVVSVSKSESRFSRHEVALLLASRRAEREQRGSHGWPMSVATDPANQGKFFVGPPTLDFAAKAEIKARELAEKEYKDKEPMGALMFRVEKRD